MCGLAGIISLRPHKFDYTSFCVLGIENDTRGGDSCGIFIDGKYEYGTGDKKLFRNFFRDSDMLNNITISQVAIVHCRKASVGAIDEAHAQPVIIKNDSGKVEYVVVHNGTIKNYKELAKKYIPNEDITNLTDSQVMARIMYATGFKVLNEYIGSAVFVIVDYRGNFPRTFLYKGCSLANATSKEPVEERPLFCCVDKRKKELIFSSISSTLFALRRGYKVYYVPSNRVCEFLGRKVVSRQIIKREHLVQSPSLIYGFQSTNTTVKSKKQIKKNKRTIDKGFFRNYYGDYSEFDDYYGPIYRNLQHKKVTN